MPVEPNPFLTVIVVVNTQFIAGIYPWLKKNIGSQGSEWDITWKDDRDNVGNEAVLQFVNEVHRTVFILRWGSEIVPKQ